jgi:hypothetical protein
VIGNSGVLERGHEPDPFDHAARPLLLWQLDKGPTRNGFFGIVVTALPDAFQFQAGTVY